MLLRLLPPLATLPLRLVGARTRRHRVGPVTLRLLEAGPADGEPWLLLHGMGSTPLSWIALFRALAGECRLIAPALSSLGGTRCPGYGLNVREAVAALTDLLDAEYPERRVSIAGISLGGWIATRLALAEPQRVERLMLIDAAGYRNQDWERIRSLVDLGHPDDVDRLYRALYHRTPWAMRLLRRGFYHAYRSPAVRHVLETIDPEDAFGPSELERLEMPVELVWGAEDGLFTLDVARAMEAALPASELLIVPGCGHAIQWECPEALVEAVLAFRQRTAVGLSLRTSVRNAG